MSTHLLKSIAVFVLLSSCASSSRNKRNDADGSFLRNAPTISSGAVDIDTTYIVSADPASGKVPVSMMELPRTEEGAFVLAPGFYESDFKTFCLQPGTPGPSNRDAYFQVPLKGSRKDIIQTILTNSGRQPDLDQRYVQLLLWSVVSKSDYNRLTPPVQATARRLLSSRQIFELQGGMMGIARQVVNVLPSTGAISNVKQLFEMGNSSYEAFERLAVLSTPSEIHRPGFSRDQWYKHQDGYYVRYLTDTYQKTKIQLYVPDGLTDPFKEGASDYIVFDPVSLVVVPANTNAQRLGVGGPIKDIVKVIIRNIPESKPRPPARQTPEPKDPPFKKGF